MVCLARYTHNYSRISLQPKHLVRTLAIIVEVLRLLSHVDEELTFIHPDDAELYKAWDNKAFDVQVANHELLGHGSGKLFQETADGEKNFDPEKVTELYPLVTSFPNMNYLQIINPLTKKPM